MVTQRATLQRLAAPAVQRHRGEESAAGEQEGGRSDLPGAIVEAGLRDHGEDLSDVAVHRNSAVPEEVGALATAQGDAIHLGPGAGSPEILKHEVGHVIQQRKGRVQATTEVAGVPVNDDPGLERDADEIGRRLT